ncbi:AAA family ATPase [Asticcacaulis sp. AC460]|uniref:AAA family ATPase n=1 Tax=Asticcacaulis sp. AC460 TaxID=1282360 RepID=UPI0009DDABB9|nr:AAA family ATPase [Asticcacaulis sp. AC460]
MKVAISGFHGSGKTTICHQVIADLKKRNINCSLVSESARSSHLFLSGDFSEKMHVEILTMHVANEMRSEYNSKVSICDRSIFDFLAYAHCRFGDEDRRGYLIDSIFDFSYSYARGYDAIFLVKSTYGNPDNDSLRRNDTVLCEEFDFQIRRIIRENSNVKNLFELTGSDKDRAVTDWIEAHLK